MPTGSAVLLHPAPRRASRPRLARRAGSVVTELVLALALIAGGTVTAVALLLLVVLAAPLGAALFAWVLWRSANGPARRTNEVRARLRRRARALGLVVLAGSQPGVLRLAAAGARDPSAPQ